MTKIERIEKARQKAWDTARKLAGGDQLIASQLQREAEMAVLRRIAADYLDDGEEGYWLMVARSIGGDQRHAGANE